MFAGVDIVIAIIVLFFAVIGALRGLVSEALALAFLVMAVLGPVLFAGDVVALVYAPANHQIDEVYHDLVHISVFAVMFMVILAIGFITRLLIGKMFGNRLAAMNNILGCVFGFLRGLGVCIALIVLAGFTAFPDALWWRQSELIPLLMPAVRYVGGWLPAEYQLFFRVDFL